MIVIHTAKHLPILYLKTESFELRKYNERLESKNINAVVGFIGIKDGRMLLTTPMLNSQPKRIVLEIKIIAVINMPIVLRTCIKTSFSMYKMSLN